MRILLTSLLLAALTVATAVTVRVFPFYDVKSGDSLTRMLLATGALWLLFALAVLALRRVPTRAAVVLVLIGSVAVGGAAMAGPPNTSTDSARYAWDGIVQNAGVSPYEYVPADPRLDELRQDWLFPPAMDDGDGKPVCDGERILTSTEVGTGDVLCTAINRATVPTIYPPTAELYFAAVRLVTGPSPEYWPLQLTGLLMSLGITGILLRALHNRGLNPRWAALWGWCPLVATEGVTNSHVDLLGGLLILVATLLVSRGKHWTGGIALGAAIAVKLIPVIAAPALLRRQPLKIIVAAVATFLVLYVPYIVASGIGVLGYLPGYLSEEGYSTGSRFILLSGFAPGAGALVVAAVLIGITVALVWWKTDPADPWLGQLVMIGVTLLIVTPRYPWYALLLVPFIAMTGRWEWLAVPLALTERLLNPSVDVARFSALVAIAVIIAVSIQRAGPGALPRLGRWLRHPFRTPANTALAPGGQQEP